MVQLTKHWQVPPRLPAEIDHNLQLYPPILRQILYNRGYATPEAAKGFLEAAPPQKTDPLLMTGVLPAVKRLHQAIQRKEPIAVYGDYDVDGVTATALLVQVLVNLGAEVRGYIPNRFDEGYGLNNDALEILRNDGVRLVVTVDCGIRSAEEARYAQQLGMDLIITDHHQPAQVIPQALAVINPKQPGDPYPEKDLAGVGLAYKLAEALIAYLKQSAIEVKFQVESFLDLVALGTVADLAPLVGENRSLVRAGLRQMRQSPRPGLQSLMGVSGIRPERLNSWDISFALGPRLNAAGRLDSALTAYQLLMTMDFQQAGQLAQQLDNQNRERQQITRQIQDLAEQIALADNPDPLLLFAADPSFNPGVVGLAASRLVERYYRPAIIAYRGDEWTRASCRSIQEFHITQALDQCADLLVRHGGHAAAAGFTVQNKKLPDLLERLQQIAARELGGRDLQPTLVAEAEASLSELDLNLYRYLDLLQPTGYSNPQPLLITRNLHVRSFRSVGKDGLHLKLVVSDDRLTFDAIAFQQGYWHTAMPSHVDLIYAFELNEYNGQASFQLNVKDIKPASN